MTALVAAFSATLPVPPEVMTGLLSFWPVRFTVTVPVSVRLPSDAWTVRLKSWVVSKSSLVVSATVMAPVAALMANAPLALPAVML